jgi:uncharacterized protein
MTTIYVDADACPVKEEILRVAERVGVVVVMVSNGGLRPSRDPMVRHVVVSKSADAADDWIVENAVTDVLGPTGRPFTPETIGMAVAMRDLKQHLRETGESRGLNPSFSPRDRSSFLQALDRTVRRAMQGTGAA